tara:strand:- start:1339 stop:2397 length:1059 start_codon:yes stop_codon:yes gene_type:complete
LKVYIPSDLKISIDKKLIFLLARPFYSSNGWIQYGDTFKQWGLDPECLELVYDINNTDVLLIPFPINNYVDNGFLHHLEYYNELCEMNMVKGYGYISGDYGKEYPEYENIYYFRMSGFRGQLSDHNKGFPAALSDYAKILFNNEKLFFNEKSDIPKIGFCGHATSNKLNYLKQLFYYLFENMNRFIQKPNRKDYEPFFISGYERFKVLNDIRNDIELETNIIFREKYRGGAKNKSELESTTLEYYENIKKSDYIICIRGTGNFSIRMYETLMMGRIPILINTDCLLPFTKHIDWNEHMIIINWDKRKNIGSIIKEFHKSISKDDFQQKQIKNRQLWETYLKPKWILNNLKEL